MSVTQKNVRRFWENVAKAGPNECWIWTGFINPGGYGQTWIDGRTQTAHRASWIIHNGPVPKDLCVLHDCPTGDNPACVNPNHLWLGTRTDNNKDMDAKGRRGVATGDLSGSRKYIERRPRGEKHISAKLTDDKVRLIFKLRSEGWTLKQIAQEVQMHFTSVWLVLKKRIWRHVS